LCVHSMPQSTSASQKSVVNTLPIALRSEDIGEVLPNLGDARKIKPCPLAIRIDLEEHPLPLRRNCEIDCRES
jgi:hypothetical protein